MIRRPPRSTRNSSSAASDVYKRQGIVNKIDQKLNNQKFIERAPSDIINQNISNRAKIENDILSLRSLRDTLSD